MTEHDSDFEAIRRKVPQLLDAIHEYVTFLSPYGDELAAMRDIDQQQKSQLMEKPGATQSEAKRKLCDAWLEKQRTYVTELRDDVARFVADNAKVLPGILSTPPIVVRSAPYSSACSAACAVATELLESGELQANAHLLWGWWCDIDYATLRVQIECELAELCRRYPHLIANSGCNSGPQGGRPTAKQAILQALKNADPVGIPTLEALAKATPYQLDTVKKAKRELAEFIEQRQDSSGERRWFLTPAGHQQLERLRGN